MINTDTVIETVAVPLWVSATIDAVGSVGSGIDGVGGTYRISKGGKFSFKHYASGWRGGSRASIRTLSMSRLGRGLGNSANVLTLMVGIYDIGNNVHENGSNSLQTFQAVGRTVGGFAGSYFGARLGGRVGALAGGYGALPGTIVGGIAGGYYGSQGGEYIATWIYYSTR